MKYNYISLFSSAGIGCFGFKEEKFECIVTNELLPTRLEIQKINKKCKYDTGYILGDITKKETKEKIFSEINFWNKKEKIEDIDVVIATPPCQGMSTANYKKNNEQKRNSLVVEAIKIIKEIEPKIFIFENVRAFMKTICTDIDNLDKPIKNAIYSNLENKYNIFYKVINFKDYGIPSSRPRTLVIGTRKDLLNISPLNLFPNKRKEISLKEVIGDLKSLNYGEIDNQDIYHFARKYPRYMEEWIKDLKEGESAFNNEEELRPYRIIKGKKVRQKSGHLGNKYRRLFWDRYGACIATRSDQLAAMDTIHPHDNRVLSIRELMRLMTIPDNFIWTRDEKNIVDKEKFLKTNELNIRRCIGEAVPTGILSQIAKKIKIMFEFEEFVKNFKEKNKYNLDNSDNYYIKAFIYEQELINTKETGSFYTPQSVVFNSIKRYETKRKKLKILEPAVGVGAFIPQLINLLSELEIIEIDVVDINKENLIKLKELLKLLNIDYNVKFNFINDDFLELDLNKKYDLIVTNPPYFKPKIQILKKYREQFNEHKINNIFVFFLKKIKNYSDELIVVIPKNFLMASEYKSIREEYSIIPIISIIDYGVKFFKNVFIEIISIHFKKGYKEKIKIEYKKENLIFAQEQFYIIHKDTWLLYRNEWFDEYIKTLQLGVFDFYRDRAITNRYLKNSGKYRILKSKNILDNGKIVNIEGYDKYVDDIENFPIKKYLNTNSIIMPNFTYNTRATILPKNTIPNGSIAILLPKEKINLDEIDLSIYSSKAFRKYYSIVKNKSKFTLNIDANSIYYIGVKKNG